MSVVEISGVSKRFGATTAVEGIELEIGEREFVSLIGPSGCGKSTLLRIIGDLIEPSGGKVVVNRKTARQARKDRDYGIVFQDPVLYDWRTVAKNVALPLEIARWPRQKRKVRVQKMLELVELTGFENHRPWQLSGGMQQRVSIARALSFDPALLLMDEPFGALDEMTRERLNMELLRIWAASGSTVVFVTHSISEAVFLSTQVVVMSPRPGRISEVVPIDLRQPRTATTREEPRFFELVDLTGFENHRPWQLSGGMQQRVSIARALSFDPALLLMDEPFGALDEMTRERLNMELLRIWAASGSTVVFVTHSISEAVFLSTQVVVMSPRPGRISEMVPIDLTHPRTATTREAPRFFELVTQVREALHLGHDLERGTPVTTEQAQA